MDSRFESEEPGPYAAAGALVLWLALISMEGAKKVGARRIVARTGELVGAVCITKGVLDMDAGLMLFGTGTTWAGLNLEHPNPPQPKEAPDIESIT